MSATGQIVVFLLIFGFLIYKGYKFLKELVNEERTSKRNKEQLKKELSEIRNRPVASRQPLSKAEITDIADYFRPHWRWMTLAGGIDPILTPSISFDKEGKIYLIKRGYDLWTRNWRDYNSGTIWEEREKALERFSVDLFGEYAEKARKFISIEYIADHLIEFEDSSAISSDFILTFSFPSRIKTSEERQAFIRELQDTPIFDTETESGI